jgi:hypothetical protein
MNDENEDFENDDELPIYDVDDDTLDLIEVCVSILHNAAIMQVNEEARKSLHIIADSLAQRFALDSMEVEEQVHETEDGQELIYKPKGGIFDEEDTEE